MYQLQSDVDMDEEAELRRLESGRDNPERCSSSGALGATSCAPEILFQSETSRQIKTSVKVQRPAAPPPSSRPREFSRICGAR